MRWVVLALAVLVLVALGGTAVLAFREGETAVEVEETVITETASVTVTVTEREQTADEVLPAAVAERRADILAAAEAGDHDALAARAPDDFSYSFGGPVEGGPAAYWRNLEQTTDERPLEILAGLLRMPYTLYGGIYVWPFAFDRQADDLTEYERELLRPVTGGDVGAAFQGEAGYAGWRAGIAPDGTWRFFIAGD